MIKYDDIKEPLHKLKELVEKPVQKGDRAFWLFDLVAYFRILESKIKPIEIDRKQGHWIYKKDNKAECSECGILHLIAQYPSGEANFCPNCGAEMEKNNNG